MMEKTKLLSGDVSRRRVDDQSVVEPEIVEAEVVGSGSNSSRIRESGRVFEPSPFPLTSGKLEAIVWRFGVTGPMQLGDFYPARLHAECALLLPEPVDAWSDIAFKPRVP